MDDLHVARTGSGSRVALLHGFTQTGACWPVLADDLARDHEVVAVDLPRHGRSAAIGGSLRDVASLLASGVGAATWLGYSMGARAALTLAVAIPEVVQALVLISGTPGIEDRTARGLRRDADAARAAAIEADGIEAFLQRWLAQPMFADVPAERDCREARLEGSASALAASLREVGTGSMAPLWDQLRSIAVPVLLITGERDAAYGAIADRMQAALGGPATHVVIAGAGHAAHLVDPPAVLAAVRAWEGTR